MLDMEKIASICKEHNPEELSKKFAQWDSSQNMAFASLAVSALRIANSLDELLKHHSKSIDDLK